LYVDKHGSFITTIAVVRSLSRFFGMTAIGLIKNKSHLSSSECEPGNIHYPFPTIFETLIAS